MILKTECSTQSREIIYYKYFRPIPNESMLRIRHAFVLDPNVEIKYPHLRIWYYRLYSVFLVSDFSVTGPDSVA